jgi:hypothetical protein
MSTLDEITKEKQRVSEALARVDEQREKLTGQLGELEATERVLARYSKGTQAKRASLRQDADRGNEGGRCSAATRAPSHCDRKTSRRQAQLANPLLVLALEGATSYGASAVANPPGHMSRRGASSTGNGTVAPGGSARLASLRQSNQAPARGTRKWHGSSRRIQRVAGLVVAGVRKPAQFRTIKGRTGWPCRVPGSKLLERVVE